MLLLGVSVLPFPTGPLAEYGVHGEQRDAAFARHETIRAYPGILIYASCLTIGLRRPVAALILNLLAAIFYAITSQGWARRSTDDTE
ncbi:hypothetical protein [Nocardia sp. NPDC052112]|uniref:hypothetical protein n=1 Tax=Nocardia sp. NPDC052112 TaxID=3155646 RepID=UPI00341AA46F